MQGGEDLLLVPGFHDEINGPLFHGFYGQFHIPVSSDKNHGGFRIHFHDLIHPENTFVTRILSRFEIHIQEDDIVGLFLQGGQDQIWIFQGVDGAEAARQDQPESNQKIVVVIYNQYGTRLFGHQFVPAC